VSDCSPMRWEESPNTICRKAETVAGNSRRWQQQGCEQKRPGLVRLKRAKCLLECKNKAEIQVTSWKSVKSSSPELMSNYESR